MPAEPQTTRIADSLARVAGRSKQAAEVLGEELDALNERIRASIKPDGKPSPIDFYELSRQVLYAALSLTDDQRDQARKRAASAAGGAGKKGGEVKAESIGWRYLTGPYKVLRGKVGPKEGPKLLCPIENDDALSKFARLDTRSNGVGTPRFYASLVILIIHLREQKLLASKRFSLMCPEEELVFHQRARLVVDEIIARIEGRSSRVSAPSRIRTSEATAPEIWIRFPYSPDELTRLTDFQRSFQFGEDGCAHFVIYRPARGDPCKLIKSLLVLESPIVDHDLLDAEEEICESQPEILEGRVPDVVNFRHYYHPPQGHARERVSEGRAVPLEQGLYLIGGQRVKSTSPSFTALKILALPWQSIDYGEPIIRGLAISTNQGGLQIASRIVLRATPIDASRKLNLGSVHADQLFNDLRADAEVESRLLKNSREPMPEDQVAYVALLPPVERDAALQSQATSILALCNNFRRAGWDVLPGFRNDSGALDKARIETEVRHWFESQEFERRTDHGVEKFTFEAIRVGPLAHD